MTQQADDPKKGDTVVVFGRPGLFVVDRLKMYDIIFTDGSCASYSLVRVVKKAADTP
jgi:hypothetical protein